MSKLGLLYLESIEKLGVNLANTNDNFKILADKTGYSSSQSVRKALVHENVYIKAAQARPIAGHQPLLKIDFITEIVTQAKNNNVETSAEELADLKDATRDALRLFISLLATVSNTAIVVRSSSYKESNNEVFTPRRMSSANEVTKLENHAKANDLVLTGRGFESFLLCSEYSVSILNRTIESVSV